MPLLRVGQSLGYPVSDIVDLNGTAIAALGTHGIARVSDSGTLWIDTPCHSLVPSDIGKHILVIPQAQKAFGSWVGHAPLVDVSILDSETWTVAALGSVELTGWAKTYDGRYWAAWRLDKLITYEVHSDQLRTLRSHETSFTEEVVALEGALWVLIDGFGAWYFEELSFPDLLPKRSGALRKPPGVQFLPEFAWHQCQCPLVSTPVFAVATPDNFRNYPAETPIGPPRLLSLNGTILTVLNSVPLGLDALGDKAVVWCKADNGIAVTVVSLSTGATELCHLPGVESICVRMQRDSVLLADNLGCVYRHQ